MFRSSVVAFYPLPRRDFYRRGSCHRSRFRTRALRPLVCSEVKKIVDRMAEILFAAEIAFRRLDGGMSQQELNLLKFATAAVASFAQVLRKSCGAICSKPVFWQQLLTTYHTTFCEMPLPHTVPVLATARKILPSVTPAATVH